MKGVHVQVAADDCFRLMKEMQQSADTFHRTGGVHNAALCDVNGIILSRMDIGRHNALDKIYGYCLRNDISIKDKIIVFSGRISSEILLKVAKIGCEIILSKSAPTELALQLAEDLGITTIGFIRNHSLNVYTHPERVLNIKNKSEAMKMKSVTLDKLQRPLKDLRISVTDRCNFRCRYCMPEEIFGPDYSFLSNDKILSFDEIERITRIFVSLGVRKLRITGGEPLLRRGLPKLIERLNKIDGVEDIGLTTNGSLLKKFAPDLYKADYHV